MHGNIAAARPRQDDPPDLFGWSPPTVPDQQPRYPQVPGYRGPDDGPSAQAAAAIAPAVRGLRRDVLDLLRDRAVEPLTADEIAVQLGRTPFAIRPRVTELRKLGLIEPATERGTNESGMTANRWRPTQEGRGA